MDQSGKIVVYCSAALSVAAIIGMAACSALQHPFWSHLPLSAASYSEQAWLSAQRAALAPTLGALSAGVTEGSDASQVTARPERWSPTEVGAALMECVNLLAPVNAQVVPLAPLRDADCGTPAPVLLRSIGGKSRIVVDPPLVMNCPMVVALSRWLDNTVQPAARAVLGSRVTQIVGSSYACRNLYNLPDARRSQHAFADAIDLPVFLLADGQRVDLTQGWGPTRRDLAGVPKLIPIAAKDPPAGAPSAEMAVQPEGEQKIIQVSVSSAAPIQSDDATAVPEVKVPAPDLTATPQAKFLRRVHQGACEVFTTVLGPEANDIHRTHFHLDLQDRNSLHVCK
ncbi:MAG: extensin family protein [Methyloceanibacter sp.]|jgi:hypothetical protein